MSAPRLTSFSHGGGCACKIPPGELEALTAGFAQDVGSTEIIVGLDGGGDDAAVVDAGGGRGLIATVDFFSPVVDDPYDWGRIAATNALSDVYAMGGTPVVALNLLGWPREQLPYDLAAEVLRGGRDAARRAGCPVLGGHSIDDPEPKYGMAVNGWVELEQLMRLDAAEPGVPLSLTKPLGTGALNSRHKATGEVFEQAITAMTTLNDETARMAVARGIRAATDVTGFGLLGHARKMARASGVTIVFERAAIPALDGAVESVAAGYVSGGTRRNLEWVSDDLDAGDASELELHFLADAQTSGGLLLGGEIPGAPVIGHVVERGPSSIVLR